MSKKKIAIKTKYGTHPCVFEKEKDMGGYTAQARGVAGALSWGKTLAEAKKMIAEAIEVAVEAGAIAHAEEKGAVRITAMPPHFAIA